MAYNIFIDADIILDVLLKREDFYKDSYAIFVFCEENGIHLYTSSSIILNVQYIGTRLSTSDKKSIASTIYYLLENFISIINPSKQTILKAYDSDYKDYEDAVQYFTAKDSSLIDYFITRNIKDYIKENNGVPILTPTQFLKQLTI
jgi:predicted nucleic acid-binding protein